MTGHNTGHNTGHDRGHDWGHDTGYDIGGAGDAGPLLAIARRRRRQQRVGDKHHCGARASGEGRHAHRVVKVVPQRRGAHRALRHALRLARRDASRVPAGAQHQGFL
jgi:hypothetical protein